ncbi:MAG: transglycosylase domain-containing protein [Marinilabiliaceae bacterium]|nr:transglycosylase domain-containing protein [Marinilabiliaceae bacterium]
MNDRSGNQKVESKGFKTYIKWFWGIFLFGLVAVVIFFTLLSYGLLGFMPTFEDLENPKSSLATDVISADGVTIGKFFVENRSQVSYEDLSPHLVNALVATEDERFYEHSGIDLRGLGRVLFKTVLMRDASSGGGSTITQQLAKMLFHGHAMTKWERYTQKIKEWVIAVKLERSYTKEEIMAMYLNRAGFIYDAYGIESASWTFFGTNVGNLKVEQAAMLVGMLKNPSLYNPLKRPEKTTTRRNVVLGQMLKSHYLNQMEFDSLKALPLELNFRRTDHKDGLAPYFRMWVQQTLMAKKPERQNYASWQSQKYYEDSIQWVNNPAFGWIEKNPKVDGTKYNIFRDGLKIHTTIDSRLQAYAEKAMEEHLGNELQPKFFASKRNSKYAPYSSDITKEQFNDMMSRAIKGSERYRIMKQEGCSEEVINKAMHTAVDMRVFDWAGERDTVMTPYDSIVYHKHILRSGMMSVDPKNGHIKVYVGGPNYKYFQYDMVSQGKRQVGSTIKPFVYALAMKEGYTPCDLVPNTPQTFLLADGTTWTPRNSGDARLGEMVSLKWGLANSNNNVTAWVMKQYSPESVAEMIHDIGIYSHIDPVYSLCLGTSDVSLYEMVGAYATFVNKGVHIDPIGITSIEDKYGNTIARFSPMEREAIDEETAFLMVNLLEGVVNQGTGRRLRGPTYKLTNQMGGKTGTTQNHSDGWFMSVMPNLVSGVWVGGEERGIHFDSMNLGQASNMAIPVFGRFILKVFADSKITSVTAEDKFEAPASFGYTLDCSDKHINADEGYEGEEVRSEITEESSSIFDF